MKTLMHNNTDPERILFLLYYSIIKDQIYYSIKNWELWITLFLIRNSQFLIVRMVEVNGIEPMASCVQGRRSPSWATPPILITNYKLRITNVF